MEFITRKGKLYLRRKVKRVFKDEMYFYNPWHTALNHLKHAGKIYRKANADNRLWQESRFL